MNQNEKNYMEQLDPSQLENVTGGNEEPKVLDIDGEEFVPHIHKAISWGSVFSLISGDFGK